MPTTALPETPADLAAASWEEVGACYAELAGRPARAVEAWLEEWSRFEEVLTEAHALAMIAYTADTTDPARERAHLRFVAEIAPRAQEQRVRLGRRLLDTGYSRPDLETTLARLRNQEQLFREANVPLLEELHRLGAAWQKLTAGFSAEWEGRRLALPRLRPFEASPDRGLRERAWRRHFAPYVEHRDQIADLFDRMLELRQEVASNAGFASYGDFAHREKNRFAYTVADCVAFQEAVAESVVPALERILERRVELLGLSSLRPWDAIDGHCGVADPHGRPALRPFSGQEELAAQGEAVFSRVDPAFGGYFAAMRREGLLDLESRPGKDSGGYCLTLQHRKRPFIFMNATGSEGDVRTFLHESGHAFHGVEAAALPLLFQRHPGSEMAEVASMSMELLAAPHLGRESGGFYADGELKRARSAHLEGILAGLVHIAAVDAMQHWIYNTREGASRDARDRKWRELRERFYPGLDWSELEDLRAARWLAQLHFFLYPFYYVEYGIAQLGALQVWRNSLEDQAEATAAYRSALALGGTRPLSELFAAAGARLVFDAAGMAELIGLVQDQLAELGSA